MSKTEHLLSLLIINRSGSLLYDKQFNNGLNIPRIDSNTILRLAGTFHALHTISAHVIPPPQSRDPTDTVQTSTVSQQGVTGGPGPQTVVNTTNIAHSGAAGTSGAMTNPLNNIGLNSTSATAVAVMNNNTGHTGGSSNPGVGQGGNQGVGVVGTANNNNNDGINLNIGIAHTSNPTLSKQQIDNYQTFNNQPLLDTIFRPEKQPIPQTLGINFIECRNFKLHCFQTPTGLKILIASTPNYPDVGSCLRGVNVLYVDYVLKNPFYELGMPIRNDLFEHHLNKFLAATVTIK
jgi:hypothetical protein